MRWLVLAALLLGACDQCGERSGAGSAKGASAARKPARQRREPKVVVVYTSVDQVFSEPVFRAFEKRSGIKVKALYDTEETKSTGVVNRLIAESMAPQADVFWSGDPVRPFLLRRHQMLASYRAKAAKAIPAAFRGSGGRWHGVAARARVLLVNTQLLPDPAKRPKSIEALVDPRFAGKAAIANPLYGTTTMHVAALFVAWGEKRAKAFFAKLKKNRVRVVSSNGAVKRLVVAGEVAFGLTDTDDANEARKAGAKVAVVYPDSAADGLGTLVMPTSVVVMKHAPRPNNARALAEFLLSARAEAMMAKRAGHMPLRSDVKAPVGARAVSSIRAMRVEYAEVAAEMRRIQPWLRQWVGL